ncbi:hypothetical protein [Pseudomonas sp. ICMP 561]|uniref:hypothetical protein n=1 Tax=Pseudomonas sp. ICMP 561 TaxID=1718918 RepID=UPI000C081696|nr:hypothetical protein [Pseudomonas sp. ICMP 561]PHN28913.1 hypothetical protein AO242_25860 [Pseudomonas sp. ICMP 561]
MPVFICAATKIGKCNTLGDQIRVKALRLGGGWSEVREDLANEAERWFGREPVKTHEDWRSVRAEVFRIE